MKLGNPFSVKPKDYGKPFREAALQSTDQMKRTGTQYGNRAAQSGAQYDYWQPRATQAVNNTVDYLSKRTTDADRTQRIAQATGNVAGEYDAARSSLDADLAAKGLTNSSFAAGAGARLAGQRFGQMASAANEADQYFDNQRGSRLQAIMGILQGQSEDAQRDESGYLQAKTGIDSNVAQTYSSIAQQETARGQAEAQAQNAGIAGLANFIGSVGAGIATGGASTVAGAGAGALSRAKKPMPTQGVSPTQFNPDDIVRLAMMLSSSLQPN